MGTKEKLAKILTKTARILPGIGSYQDKESARESDKKLRDYLSGELARYLNAIEKLKTDLSRKGSLSFLKELDDISRQIDKLSRTIRYASRGYAGVFASYQADEKALSDLFEFDRSLKGEITGLTPLISQICEKDGGLASPLLNELRDRLFGVEQKVAERETLIG
ncbi:MAG: hypothetical protein JSV40_10515 [Deltaproteobacteria bacterium]|jgi:hypothetical protein|nr:MAG: hypothetical protein JSV40_10515 [Deltaproteobacteria bacterium]